jgi:short-subunit dehydrogenase involved in D-alanine esterification of teichoic acids
MAVRRAATARREKVKRENVEIFKMKAPVVQER